MPYQTSNLKLFVMLCLPAYSMEGDIALTERDGNVYEKTRFRRSAVRQRKKLWPNRVVPYEIEEALGKLYFIARHRSVYFVTHTKKNNQKN